MNNLKKIICILLTIPIVFSVTACNSKENKNKAENKTKKQAKQIEYGNTMGNLQNDGTIATDGENIYYNDYRGLFSNSLKGGKKKSISPDYAKFINVVGDWIYYYSTSETSANKGLYKVKKDGKELTMLRKDCIEQLIVTNEAMYVSVEEKEDSDYPTLERIDFEHPSPQPEHIYEGYTENLNLENGWLYFYSSMEAGICKIDTKGNNYKKICSINLDDCPRFSNMIVSDNVIYYMLNSTIYSVNTDGSDNKIFLTEDDVKKVVNYDFRFSSFNISNGYMYLPYWDKLYQVDVKSKDIQQISSKLVSEKKGDPENSFELGKIEIINNNFFFLQNDSDYDIGMYKLKDGTNEFSKFE